MRRAQHARALTVVPLLLLLLLPALTHAEVEITLKNSFIEQYKNRATINVNFVIDKAHKSPNSPAKDGDLHVAGRADEVGLPIVAEIMNARLHKNDVDLVHQLEGRVRPSRCPGPGGSGPSTPGSRSRSRATS